MHIRSFIGGVRATGTLCPYSPLSPARPLAGLKGPKVEGPPSRGRVGPALSPSSDSHCLFYRTRMYEATYKCITLWGETASPFSPPLTKNCFIMARNSGSLCRIQLKLQRWRTIHYSGALCPLQGRYRRCTTCGGWVN